MTEYIKREDILEWFRAYGHIDEPIPFEDLVTFLRDTPAADVVEVVRCKDCKWWNDCEDESYCSCPDGLDNYAMPDDFCSYGERRDNEC